METRAGSGAGAGRPAHVQFGPFDLDLRGGELRKEGRRIRLQEQPFQILRMLLETPGEVVTREDIRKCLWPDNTIVEFDHSINAAVTRLRETLRDSAEKPRYIETVARRGYRFIGKLETPAPDSPTEAVSIAPAAGATEAHAQPARPGRSIPRYSWIAVALTATIVLMVWATAEYGTRMRRAIMPPLQPLIRLDVDLGSEAPNRPALGPDAILSPDGTQLVYVSKSRLLTRRLDQADAAELPGTEDAESPFFSPDGRWIGFFARGRLRKVPAEGGAVIDLAEAPLGGLGGGSWGEDGYIVAAVNYVLQRIPSSGGASTPLTDLAPGEIVHRWPQVLQGGKAVLFSSYRSMSGVEGANIDAISVANRQRKTLVHDASWGRYLPSGHLVYLSKGTLFAVPLDLNRLEVRGTPAAVLDSVAYSAALGAAQIDFSRTGMLVYRDSRAEGGLVTMQWVDESGKTTPIIPVPGNYLSPALSADGSRLAFTSGGDVWEYDLRHPAMVRLTFGGGFGNPLWTADGRYVVFRGRGGIFWVDATGTGRPKPLMQGAYPQLPWSITSDGKRIAFVELHPVTGADLWTVPVENGPSGLRAGKPELFLRTPFQERSPMLSPDGRWLAYMSNESGEYHVYVDAFPRKGSKRRVSTEPAGYPAWARNGSALFFIGIKEERPLPLMMAAYRAHGERFAPDKPRVWWASLAHFATARGYDPAPDGKRVVAITAADLSQGSHDRVVFLLNFFDELKRRAPVTAN